MYTTPSWPKPTSARPFGNCTRSKISPGSDRSLPAAPDRSCSRESYSRAPMCSARQAPPASAVWVSEDDRAFEVLLSLLFALVCGTRWSRRIWVVRKGGRRQLSNSNDVDVACPASRKFSRSPLPIQSTRFAPGRARLIPRVVHGRWQRSNALRVVRHTVPPHRVEDHRRAFNYLQHESRSRPRISARRAQVPERRCGRRMAHLWSATLGRCGAPIRQT